MLSRLGNVGLRSKMVVFILFISAIAIFGAVWYIGNESRKEAQKNTEQQAMESTRRFANMIQAEAQVIMDTAKTLASSFEAMKESGEPSRPVMDAMMKRVLDQNPQYIAVWSRWEPNALDGKDIKYRGAPGNDASGQYSAYWNRMSGDITVKTYEPTSGPVDFYKETMGSKKEVVFNPVKIEYEDEQTLKIVMAVPIKVRNRNVGVVGIDLPVRSLEPLIKRVKFFETPDYKSYGFLMANDGMFIAHPTKWANVGKHMVKRFNFNAQSERAVINGQETFQYKVSKTTGKPSFYPFVPIKIGNADSPWSLSTNTATHKVIEKAEQTFKFSMVVGAIAVVILSILVWFLVGGITRPILNMASVIRRVARDRDLTLDVPVASRDEIGIMGREFNNMMKAMRDSFSMVDDAAKHVNTQSSDVAKRATANRDRAEDEEKQMGVILDTVGQMGQTAGSVQDASKSQADNATDASKRMESLLSGMMMVDQSTQEQIKEAGIATERVSVMGETGAKVTSAAEAQNDQVIKMTESMRTIANSVEEVARAANRATEQGRTVLDAATEGQQTIDATVDGMRAIKDSSEQIAEIIGVITDISEQTNLLALNAAIEAARAGVHGKGFAVVADEVGKLAQRSSEAAKEITQLIKDSTNKVEDGTRLTDRSQEALRKIAKGGEINMLAIEEIGRAAQLLADNSRQVNTLVEDLNKLAHSIADMAGQQGERRKAAQAALESLVQKANTISEQVAKATDLANTVDEEMQSIVSQSDDMREMTDMQAGRSQKLRDITTASAARAKKTAVGAGEVVGITLEMQRLATNLTRQVSQFKISKGPVRVAVPDSGFHAESNPG